MSRKEEIQNRLAEISNITAEVDRYNQDMHSRYIRVLERMARVRIPKEFCELLDFNTLDIGATSFSIAVRPEFQENGMWERKIRISYENWYNEGGDIKNFQPKYELTMPSSRIPRTIKWWDINVKDIPFTQEILLLKFAQWITEYGYYYLTPIFSSFKDWKKVNYKSVNFLSEISNLQRELAQIEKDSLMDGFMNGESTYIRIPYNSSIELPCGTGLFKLTFERKTKARIFYRVETISYHIDNVYSNSIEKFEKVMKHFRFETSHAIDEYKKRADEGYTNLNSKFLPTT